MVAVLHNIRSVYNVGSIFRTADAAGIEKVYLCGVTPTPIDRFGRERRDFHKTALGAEKIVPWEYAPSTLPLLRRLKKEGYGIVAVEQDSRAVSIWKLGFQRKPSFQAPQKVVLVFGDEVQGLSAAILKRADRILEIPMFGKKESLNVSVAFGIVAYQLLREFRIYPATAGPRSRRGKIEE
ncbi:MAG: RNA methyltransferase [Nanoarchaeota archaeon]|nr:RNA methyltransferase [Nanoarchaeota archaeon]